MKTVLYTTKAGQYAEQAAWQLAEELAAQPTSKPILLINLETDPQPATGIAEWLKNNTNDLTQLQQACTQINDHLYYLTAGHHQWPPIAQHTQTTLITWINTHNTIINAGTIHPRQHNTPNRQLANELLIQADQRILITTTCQLAINRALNTPQLPRPDQIIVTLQPDRTTTPTIIAETLQRPLAGTITVI